MHRPLPDIRRHGFTLIEILFALALIAILASIVLLAGNAVVGGSREKSTQVTLAALKGMLAEYETKTRLNQSPKFWLWYGTGGTAVLKNTINPNGEDFWKIPGRDSASLLTPKAGLPMDAPGQVAGGNYDRDPAQTSPEEITRNGSRQILNTQLAMSRILAMPANRKALELISSNNYFTPKWVAGNRLKSPGNDLVLHSNDDGVDNVYYPQGAKIIAPTDTNPDKRDTIGLICVIAAGSLQSASTPPTSDNTNWRLDNSPPTPILMDSWGNPILFVPGTGLRVRKLNGKETLSNLGPDVADQTDIIVSPEGKVERAPGVAPKLISPGRPFFASAGPDGDFSKGDDNLYSFEQP